MQQGCVHVYYYNNTLGECQVPVRLAGQGARVGGWVCLSAQVHKQVERAGPGRDAAVSEAHPRPVACAFRAGRGGRWRKPQKKERRSWRGLVPHSLRGSSKEHSSEPLSLI